MKISQNNNPTILAMHDWIKSIAPEFNLNDEFKIEKIADDASVRQYYLLQPQNLKSRFNEQFVIMHTPVNDSMHDFIKIGNFLSSLNLAIKIPKVLATKFTGIDGFLLLSYLGEELLFKHLNIFNVEKLYGICLQRLANIQSCQKNIMLPNMDRSYIKVNLMLFKKWYLETYLNLPESGYIVNLLVKLESFFWQIFSSQPQTFVHLDYHSKNIMLDPTNLFDQQQQLGILDFQDAMIGPITYDLVSLLQDAYITWPVEVVEKILVAHYDYLVAAKIKINLTKAEFLRCFYLTGLQRHLKNLGIFVRLKYFYQKPNYMKYIPNLLNYIFKTCALFTDPEIVMLHNLLQQYASSIIS